jgi:ubiquinol-cytochrome c reductase iron-sulfur subunit
MAFEVPQVDKARRRFLVIATTTIGLSGIGAAAVPFLASWRPTTLAKAIAAPLEVDLRDLAQNEMMTVEWRGLPIYILHRSAAMLHTLVTHNGRLKDPYSDNTHQQPTYAKTYSAQLNRYIWW